VIGTDAVRLPGRLDPLASAYKDWLHLNVFDHDAGLAGLVNVSVHGRPSAAATQVVGAALVDVGGNGWAGDVRPGSWADASIATGGISTPAVTVTLAERGVVLAAVDLPGLAGRLRAMPRTAAFAVDTPQRFGSGWICWRVIPELAAEGALSAGGTAQAPTIAYHDHNWGRWHWGDDIGWEWGCFVGRHGGSVVVARTTDRAHRGGAGPQVLVDHGGVRRRFTSARAALGWSGPALIPTRRVPGALASLHEDRRRPDVPANLRVAARSGGDAVDVVFTGRAMAQLILADPVVVGYSFLHEISGRFEVSGRLNGRGFGFDGIGIVEWLE
jgi:hypothetical protein